MAVVNTKSTAVTNADAATQTNLSQKIAGGRLRESVGNVKFIGAESIGSTFRLARIRSSDRVSRVMLSCDAITTCAGDVGIYDIAANGGAVVDADLFASAQALATALVNEDVTHEAYAANPGFCFRIADVEKPLWQALGLSADPNKLYDIAVTLTAAAGSYGNMAMKVQYVDGN